METLIDLDPVPVPQDYARWAFEGSGLERMWSGFDEFEAVFMTSKTAGAQRGPRHREEDFAGRLALACHHNRRLKEAGLSPHAAAKKLVRRFLETYREHSFVHEDVHRVLPRLAPRFNMGVVSNFKLHSGIETLLGEHGLTGFFKFVITSIGFGFRKPHPDIYRAALRRCGSRPENVVFVGDDPRNDFLMPRKMGMRSILFDRHHAHNGKYDSVHSFDELAVRLI
jgi:putative hydrolase of the HAD superfamily